MESGLYHAKPESSWLRVSYYYASNYNVYTMSFHTHPEHEIMYAAHGRCYVSWTEPPDREKTLLIKEGDYIFISENVPHRLIVEKGVPCRVLNLEMGICPAKGCFSLRTLCESADFRFFMQSAPAVFSCADGTGDLHNIIILLQKTLYRRQSAGDRLAIDLRLALFYSEIARQFADSGARRRSGSGLYVRRALKFMEENFDGQLDASVTAKEAGICVTYLHKLFRAETGMSFTEKLSAMRVEKAKYLLMTSAFSVTDIAVSSGFNNRQHFNAVFTRLAGCTPGEYRRNRGNSVL